MSGNFLVTGWSVANGTLTLTIDDEGATEIATALYYDDTAAGIAATTEGDQFGVVSGDEVIRYRHGAGSTAVEVARLPTTDIRDEVRYETPNIYGAKIAHANAFTGQALGGATANGATVYDGYTIPVGQSGFATYVTGTFTVGLDLARAFQGKRVRFATLFDISGGALAARGWNITKSSAVVTGQDSGDLGTFSGDGKVEFIAGKAIVYADYVVGGVEANVTVGLQQGSGTTGDNTEVTIAPVGMWYTVLDESGFETAALKIAPAKITYLKEIEVKPDGTGDYTTLAAAIAAEGGGSSYWRRVLYRVHPGIYTDIQYSIPNFADVLGAGQLGSVWLKGEQAEDATIADITDNSTIQMDFTSRLINLKITAKNMRYPIHSDAPTNSGQDPQAVQEFIGCLVEHYGNQEARDYQTSLGGSGNPGGVFTAEQAFGCGTHSGEKIVSRDSVWIGGRYSGSSAFGFHTNKDFSYPCEVRLEGGRVTNPAGGVAVGVNNYGTGGGDFCLLDGVQVDGRLTAMAGTWLSADIENTPANRTADCMIEVRGRSVPWTSTNTTGLLCLELRSTSNSAGSAVEISGTAAEVLFGVTPDTQNGGVGYPGRVRSQHAINGVTGTAIGARLGDLSGGSLTLTVALNGGSPVDLVLDQDYSAMSNTTAVAALNTLMTNAGGGATFYQLAEYVNAAPVFQRDHETVITSNESSAVILKGMVVAYDGGFHLGRIATNSDARSVIAGIALENIAPGEPGRVQTSGLIAQSQVLFSGTPAIAFGDTFGVHTTAGYIIEGASVDFLRAVHIGAVNVLEIV